MAKRKRTSSRIRAAEARAADLAEAGAPDRPPVDPDVARFAARVREEREAEKAEKRAAREARRREEEAAQLVLAKDAAAAEVKRLRGQLRTSPEQVAAAEAAYRQALAALITAETGAAPRWADVAGDAADDEPEADELTPADEPEAGAEE